MAFACQRNSYQKTLETIVVSCAKHQSNITCIPQDYAEANTSLKTELINGYNVILKDTILFPEGGGQPDDRGTINGIPVLSVQRFNSDAVHFLESSLTVGDSVTVRVDWERRFDHMQQHSAQHLISAIAEGEFNFSTTAWWLNRKTCYIELDTSTITGDQLKDMERIANEHIRNAEPVSVKMFASAEDARKEAHTRGLPDVVAGPIRIIRIANVDNNICCGTHVSNLSHLQVIKLLYAEKGKKGKTNLYFLAGKRVLVYMENTLNKEKALTSILKNGPDKHVELAEKLQKSSRSFQKSCTNLLRDLAQFEVEKLKRILSDGCRSNFISVYRKEGDFEFLNTIAKCVMCSDVLLFLCAGENNSGMFMLAGNKHVIGETSAKICEIISGKGTLKGDKFQGKAMQLQHREKVEEFLKTYFDNISGV